MSEVIFAATKNGGNSLGGLIALGLLAWIGLSIGVHIYEALKQKGCNVRHRSQTTIEPRK